MTFASLGTLVKRAGVIWVNSRAPTMGASLAYYTVFSLAPLLVITLSVAGIFLGERAARLELTAQLQDITGPDVAQGIELVLRNTSAPEMQVTQLVVGVLMLLFAASGVFGELQLALNTIWEVEPKPNRGFWGLIQDRFLSVVMVLGTIFLLLVSLIISTTLNVLATYWVPATHPGSLALWWLLQTLINFAVITALFALIYRYLPDAKIAWSDVWVGAVLTTLLFLVGKYLLGLYLAVSGLSSSNGAAGALTLFLLWVYYTAQIFLYGAACTRAYAEQQGTGVQPADNAVALPARKGLTPVSTAR